MSEVAETSTPELDYKAVLAFCVNVLFVFDSQWLVLSSKRLPRCSL